MSDELAHAVEDLLEDREVSLLMMNGGSPEAAGAQDTGGGSGHAKDLLGTAGEALEATGGGGGGVGSGGGGGCLLLEAAVDDDDDDDPADSIEIEVDGLGDEDEEDRDLLRETFGSDAEGSSPTSGLNGVGGVGVGGASGEGGGSGSGTDAIIGGPNADCGLCMRALSEPVILACLHRFDLQCLEAAQGATAAGGFLLICPRCQTPTVLNPDTGLAGLTRDHLYIQELQGAQMAEVKCGGCTTGAEAVAKCRECADYLCSTCRQAHSVMKMFSRHHVQDLLQPGNDPEAASGLLLKPIYCQEHPADQLKYYCRDCASLHCPECVATNHKLHNIEQAATAGAELASMLSHDARALRDNRRRWEREQDKLQERLIEIADSRQHNEGAINEALASYRAFLDEAGKRFLEENRRLHADLEMRAMELLEHTAKGAEQMAEAAAFVQAYSDRAGPTVLAYAAKVLRDWSATLLRAHWDTDLPTAVPFLANHPKFRAMVLTNFGAFGGAVNDDGGFVSGSSAFAASVAAAKLVGPGGSAAPPTSLASGLGGPGLHAAGDMQVSSVAAAVAGINSVPYSAVAAVPKSMAPVSAAAAALERDTSSAVAATAAAAAAAAVSYGSNPALFGLPPPSQPSPGAPGSDSGLSNGSDPLLSSMLVAKLQLGAEHHHPHHQPVSVRTGTPTSLDFGGGGGGGGVITGGGAPGSLDSPGQQAGGSGSGGGGGGSLFPVRTGRCLSMTVRHRWGSLGASRGQFNSPHGFCLGTDEEIVVADTQNHRVQVFDKSGEHKFQFGVPGREEGQLWYPRKVVVVRQSGKFIVCDRGSERSRMQIFSRTGNFLRKITVRYIDIVAGLAINSQGHIVAVDSVSPTVFVIAENGDLVKWFDCSSYMREPSDIAVHGREYFICDFKGHCVCVFQEDGMFVRRIGSESITNFPNGIDISDHGDVLVGDSHGNKFHVAVFNRSGQLTSEFECPTVKVSRCCGLKITSEGYVVTLAKNNHHVLVLNTLYIS